LPHANRPAAELHLESCPACRTLFRRLTAERFPKIRNYTILAELGRGGFGVVYKAFQHTKKRTEALKVLFDKSAQRTAFFENEVRLVAQLQHPNIATLYEANLAAQPLYYTMEFVAGQHLDDYLRGNEVSLERRLELFKTVCGALAYAHRQGVVHRDLKPQNILIDAQGQPRLVDFGIAKKLGLQADLPLAHDGTPQPVEGALGTYGYIAPEQMAGEDVDGRADIYSLGALLFHVVTGQPARFAPQIDRLREVLREREVSRADDLAAIIGCCVQPLPEQRYPNCEALVGDLDSYLAGLPIQARTDRSPGYRAARIAAVVLRKHPLPIQVAAVLGIVFLLDVLLWYSGVGWYSTPASGSQAALVAFTTSTLDAIRRGELGADLPGLQPGNKKSWRLLYGRLMEALAEAEPSVVVWDYYFPDCQPDFDPAFLHGLRAARVPVIVGSKEFDLNGEPVCCADFRDAVRTWGSLAGTGPTVSGRTVFTPLVLERGFNRPIPSLALAATAAARHPDCDPDIATTPSTLTLRYHRRQAGPGQPRWLSQVHVFPTYRSQTETAQRQGVSVDDTLRFARHDIGDVAGWAARAIPLERVLAAEPAERRRWFAGRAVLIGKMLPPEDEYSFGAHVRVFGCQVQATVLDKLLSQTNYYRALRPELAARILPWGLVMFLLVRALPTRGTWRRRVTVPVGVVVLVLTFAAVAVLADYTTTRLTAELLIAGSAAVACGTVVFLVKLLHQRHLHLTPGAVWTAEGTTASATPWATATTSSSAGKPLVGTPAIEPS
jgi:predicted Ser/Thr protein kinase